jgi:hypothetical protein
MNKTFTWFGWYWSSDDGRYGAKHIKVLFILEFVALHGTYPLFRRITAVAKLIGHLTIFIGLISVQ